MAPDVELAADRGDRYRNVFQSYPALVYPAPPDFARRDAPAIIMGKKSGLDKIGIWAQKLDIDLNQEERMTVLKPAQQKSNHLKRVGAEDEFAEIVRAVKG